ncbi:hypothetical protein BK816_05290 [Boudabousia tangfeifanii]|uniref:Error-prone DNA polymerase n=1 Tax=Boudabousia tangfeifanii TaxID=1912795 RepID=A0A1D9MKM5_9ACTO|nr:error-prone DNA polymerase [Boudabousia tangfeifanii]AOZ72778.1 hypothetical protein BK816_05290 [Boudabousia tangfeifanii]
MFDRYFELHAHSAFSFLAGTALPAEVVAQAAKLKYAGIAICDNDGLFGAVQIHQAAQKAKIKVGYGSELSFQTHGNLPILAWRLAGYRQISTLISKHNLNASQYQPQKYSLAEIPKSTLVLTGSENGALLKYLKPGRYFDYQQADTALGQLKNEVSQGLLAVEMPYRQQAGRKEVQAALAELAQKHRLPLVATCAAKICHPDQIPLGDILAANAAYTSLNAGQASFPTQRPYLRSLPQISQHYRDYPQALDNAYQLGKDIAFDLSSLEPRLPTNLQQLQNPNKTLREKVAAGAKERYGTKTTNPGAWQQLEHELKVIAESGFATYFLIVHDIVHFCQRQGILCQGRGSAANSVVCYVLGITAVDAYRHQLMFERFLSSGRKEPPDIDIDIESDRRDEVIDYVYQTYGRERAALVCNVVTYRPRAAVREVARAAGYSQNEINEMGRQVRHSRRMPGKPDPFAALPPLVQKMAPQLLHLPRHLGIHPGGMVLADRPLSEVCPLQWASKTGRTILQWDKTDCAQIGLVKFDLLGLGMLGALQKCFRQLQASGINGTDGKQLNLHNLPPEDPKVYDMLCQGDTIGLFQVESRAQMNTLPRLKPRCFYDLVIEVSLIRPGPIQGNAVNPYLRRRAGKEAITYPHPLLKPALQKTLGVPLFQEQLMQIAIDVADFTPAQADALRRAMGAKRSSEQMAEIKKPLLAGMAKKGVPAKVAEEIFQQLASFALYGFPESHAFSFAYIVYASAWLKRYYPEVFFAALLNSQPMGFYSPATLVADAKRHQVIIEPIDINQSHWENIATLATPQARGKIRLGFLQIKGLSAEVAQKIVTERQQHGPYTTMAEVASRVGLKTKTLNRLAQAGAFESLAISIRQALWQSPYSSVETSGPSWYQPPIAGSAQGLYTPHLPALGQLEKITQELATTRVMSRHPMELWRPQLEGQGIKLNSELGKLPAGERIWLGGLITHRQRPPTAHGITFLSLEDETGLVNVVCSVGFWQKYHRILGTSSAVLIRGIVERDGGASVLNADAAKVIETQLQIRSRDYC